MSQSYKEQVEAWDILWDEGHRWVRLGDAQDLAKAADAAREERDALRAERDALMKDAERYRAIRMRQWELDGTFTVNLVCLPHANQSLAMYFDDAVDAAIAAIAGRAWAEKS